MWTKAGVSVLGLVLLAILLFLSFASGRPQAGAAGPAQPIAFSHAIHAGQYQIDCQYCHSDARRSEYAGIPSVTRCMGCHKITAADRPEIKKLAEYLGKQEAIPWVRVYKVPEYVYFPHKPHIRADVACQTCHGPVQTMDVVAARTGQRLTNDLLNLIGFAPAAPPLTMGWCIECHTARKASLECSTCHH
ncbi:MAG: cytochrome c3 family protein [Candidatus Rokubacteria bacterium]|nr:cytochrome c3 family protein [Candidatus Rokubacteria bacterium]